MKEYRALLERAQDGESKLREDDEFLEEVKAEHQRLFEKYKDLGSFFTDAMRGPILNIDSQILSLITSAISRVCDQALGTFDADVYVVKLKTREMKAAERDDGTLVLTARHWIKYGEICLKNFKVVPSITYILGAVDPRGDDDDEVRQSGAGEKERRKMAAVASSSRRDEALPTKLKAKESDGRDTEEQMVRRTFRSLKKVLQARKSERVNLWKFTLHPKSFDISVRNIFNVTALASEGKIYFDLEEGGTHYIRLLKTGEAEEKKMVVDQMVFSLTMKDWEVLVRGFNITTPMIDF